MQHWENLKKALPRLWRGGAPTDGETDETHVGRRDVLFGLGLVGAVAFAGPALLASSAAEAAGVSIYIGPRRRYRYRRYHYGYHGYHPYRHRRAGVHIRLGRRRRRRRRRVRRRRRW